MGFFIEKPEFDAQTGAAVFNYRLNELAFREVLTIAPGFQPEILNVPQFISVLNLTACVLGVSYFKLRAPTEISFPDFALTPQQQQLVLDIYENGLGEFYARNNLARFGKLTLNGATCSMPEASASLHKNHTPRSLLLIGGGKDSLVSAQLLQNSGQSFTPFAVNPKGPIASSIQVMGTAPLYIKRKLDPEMLHLSSSPEFFNGHVPSTAINSLIAALAAILFGYDQIILSNERSASEANTVHDGREVNHQHSKSFVFETLLHQTIFETTGGALNYFSLLRPFSELKIASIFAQTTRFDNDFSSCNSNFRQGDNSSILWCNSCPKCHFVFLMFAPFMPIERLKNIFGINILDQKQNTNSFATLTGLSDQKPWECVGEILEAAATLYALSQSGPWQSNAIICELAPRLATKYGTKKLIATWKELMKDSDEHHLPDHLLQIVFSDQ